MTKSARHMQSHSGTGKACHAAGPTRLGRRAPCAGDLARNFEQTENFIIGNCGEHFMAGEHFAVDESFAFGNCGELFVIGENVELTEHFIVGKCNEHLQ